MATVIFAVGMAIAGRAALMAMRDNLIRDSFAHSLIKYKVFADKANGKPLRARATGVLNDATLNMPDFIETVVFHPGAGFLTTNTAGTVHHYLFICMFPQHFNRFWQLFTKRIRRDFQSIFEMADFILIVVAHINKDRVRIVQHRIHICRLQIIADITGVKSRIVNTVSNDTVANFHTQHPK